MQKTQKNHSIGDLFQKTLGMPDPNQLKWHDNTVASIDVPILATNK